MTTRDHLSIREVREELALDEKRQQVRTKLRQLFTLRAALLSPALDPNIELKALSEHVQRDLELYKALAKSIAIDPQEIVQLADAVHSAGEVLALQLSENIPLLLKFMTANFQINATNEVIADLFNTATPPANSTSSSR